MKTIAFDLDGTLLKPKARQTLLLRAIAARYGIPLECDTIWHKKREGLSNLALLLDAGTAKPTAQAIAADWQYAIETPYWLSLDTLFTDALPILLQLNTLGFRVILITARKNRFLMQQQIHQLGIHAYLQEAHCVDPANTVQEKSAILARSAACAYTGDTELDCNAAQMAGIPFLAVSTGQRSADYLRRAGAAHVHASLTSAMEYFLASSASQQNKTAVLSAQRTLL